MKIPLRISKTRFKQRLRSDYRKVVGKEVEVQFTAAELKELIGDVELPGGQKFRAVPVGTTEDNDRMIFEFTKATDAIYAATDDVYDILAHYKRIVPPDQP